ncbi:MAG: leucine-rich repeat protein [Ruminococcus sp.]|nr:leucine-rich repeat protein [Ruminococcus sp.]MCM1381578.1 leucine-rich repeat protein [Muribaculaceae bacterium]MCM1479330.1 leucine-rich repeat protein [Muribaculaceae bacterium]
MKNNFSEFSEVLKAVVDYGGIEILKDKKKTNSIISDLVPGDDKFNGEKKLLNDAYSCNAVRVLVEADTREDKQHKAIETAKEKLTSNYVSSDGADMIIKAICGSLGWNVQNLFANQNFQQPQKSVAVKPTNSEPSKQYSQPNNGVPVQKQNTSVSEPQPVMQYNQQHNGVQPMAEQPVQAYSQPIQIVQNEKKSLLTTILKLAALAALIVIIFSIVKKDDDNKAIINETQAPATEISEHVTEMLTEETEQPTETTTTALTSAETSKISETETTEISGSIVSETQATEIAAEVLAIPETTVAETTQIETTSENIFTTVVSVTTTETTVSTTEATTSAIMLSDGIDWDSIPYANEEDFRLISYDEFDPDKPIYLDKYNGSEKILKIPLQIKGSNITDINRVAFKGNEDIVNVNIPFGVNAIRNYAFNDCENLKSVVIPDSVKYIGDFCFYGCKNLEVVNIPDGVEQIGTCAFRDCNLTNVYLPDSIKEIGGSVFTQNENIKITYKGVVYDAKHTNELRDAVNS